MNDMMKRVFLFLVILWGGLIVGFAQQKLEGFFGFKFGTSKETVKLRMRNSQNGKLCEEDKESLMYENCYFAGYPDSFIVFWFTNNRLNGGSADIDNISENECADMKEAILLKYFPVIKNHWDRLSESTKEKFYNNSPREYYFSCLARYVDDPVEYVNFFNGDFIGMKMHQDHNGISIYYRCDSLWRIRQKQRWNDL